MAAILHALGIEWSALIAQIINFAILIFILSRYVYKPVLNVIDQRRTTIAESMEKAQEIDRRKEELDKERVVILRKADEEAGALLERAKKEAEDIRTEIEKAAKNQADYTLEKGRQQLENDRATMVREMQTKLAHAIVLSAEKILRREFSKEDQENFEEELKSNLPSMLS
jgi:F-type H+-transporting ATPase subunit b